MAAIPAPLTPAEPSIWVDGLGYLPVPAACPLCGCKTRRSGNASDRRVYCTNPAMVGTARACYWNSTVYGGYRQGQPQ
jgi:hypothetical protein